MGWTSITTKQGEMLKELYYRGKLERSELKQWFTDKKYAMQIILHFEQIGLIKKFVGIEDFQIVPVINEENRKTILATGNQELAQAWNFCPRLEQAPELIIMFKKRWNEVSRDNGQKVL